MPSAKSPNPIDVHVGSRVRLRRMMMSMSQEKLGENLGITFQQIQKYEKGTNRIGASRLQHIATVLKVPISFFFEEAPGSPEEAADHVMPNTQRLLAKPAELEMATLFSQLSPEVQRSLISVAKASLNTGDHQKAEIAA